MTRETMMWTLREAALNAADRRKYATVVRTDPSTGKKQYMFPIPDAEHASLALGMIEQSDLTPEEKKKVRAAAARKLQEAGPEEQNPGDQTADASGSDSEDSGSELTAEQALQQARQAAYTERVQLLPEYSKHFFVEDLPSLDPEDPFNQGIVMRDRINRMREATGLQPVG